MSSSPALQELVIVREWLHDTAPAPALSAAPAGTGYRRFTRLRLAQAQRMGGASKDSETLVRTLDPDAVHAVSQDGHARALSIEDANFEKALAQALYAHVRAGKLEEALEVAYKAQQPWRAAAIRGGLLFRWPALDGQPSDDDSDTMSDDGSSSSFAWSGNPRRALWKRACTAAALSPSLPPTERALYAALAPAQQTAAVLRGACRTWADHLWASVVGACERKLGAELVRVGAGSWEKDEMASSGADGEGEGDADANPAGGRQAENTEMDLDQQQNQGGNQDDEGEDEAWAEEWRSLIANLETQPVEEGPDGRHPILQTQLRVILNDTDNLFRMYTANLPQMRKDHPITYARNSRFFALLALFFQLVDVQVPPEETQTIVEDYLTVLENAHHRPLIALYSAALGETAIARYAHYLVTLGTTVGIDDRRDALSRAAQHGLDMEKVAIMTAMLSVDVAFRTLPKLTGSLPPIQASLAPGPSAGASDAEALLMRSIEWTTIDLLPAASQTQVRGLRLRATALEHANAIVRYLLGAGKLGLAIAFLGSLPRELGVLPQESQASADADASMDGGDVSMGMDMGMQEDGDRSSGMVTGVEHARLRREEQAHEYREYVKFAGAWAALDRAEALVQPEARPRADARREEQLAWRKECAVRVGDAREQVQRLLEGAWLVPEAEGTASTRAMKEQKRVRQIYVPELVVRLHTLLFESRHEVPENLRQALELANTVADGRYELYEDFGASGGRTIASYLALVRAAVLGALEDRGGSDPFRIVKSVAI